MDLEAYYLVYCDFFEEGIIRWEGGSGADFME